MRDPRALPDYSHALEQAFLRANGMNVSASVPPCPGRRRVLGASLAGISTFALPTAARASSVITPSSAPSAPTITSAVPAGYLLSSGSANHGAIQVTWGAVTGATAYQVKYRTPSGGGSYTTFGTSTSATSLVVTGLDDDASVQYDVVVVASNDGGTSEDSLSETSRTLIAVGGTVTSFLSDGTVGTAGTRYVLHSFTEVGDTTLDWNRPGELSVDHLVVGGGGAGGAEIAGGGGAGEFIERQGVTLTEAGYTITVGAGGSGGGADASDTDGGSSSAFGDTAAGGGGGGRLNGVGRPGGSGGGGGGAAGGAGGASTAALPGLGSSGGAGSSGSGPDAVGGGGGGAGGSGEAGGGQAGGDGGDGQQSDITGGTYAGGGGGGINNDLGALSAGPAGAGQAGGGKGGDSSSPSGVAADSNTGSGGGGAANVPNGGGDGGSGIVVLRYALPDATT